METIGILLNWIVVSDIEPAIRFYTNVLGLKLLSYDKEFKWAELAGKEGSTLGITQANPHLDAKAGSNAVITICVKNLEEAKQELAKKKIRLIGEVIEIPGHVKLQSFIDADGNNLQLVQKLNDHAI